MSRYLLIALTFSALLGASLAAGCKSNKQLVSGCSTDEDCGSVQNFRCNRDTGECLCRTNGACKPGETCNAQGYCQAKVGCYETRDCPAGYFCDPASNTCLANGRCASDLHCKQGQLCDLATNLCKPGCRASGDCNLGDACICTTTDASGAQVQAPCTCDATSAADRQKCPIGACVSGTCVDNSYCKFGEVCATPPGGGLKQCINDYDPKLRPYCDNCVYAPGSETCGTGPNFCLYSTYTSTTYCGVDCSDGQQCANGYDCADVIVVYMKWQCFADSDCSSPEKRSSQVCTLDSDCPLHGFCAKDPGAKTGFCAGKCLKHEGANQSFCSCILDDDCAQDSCDTVTRTCDISKRPCDINTGAGCRKIRCVDFGDTGGCQIGMNCKPLEGLTCADVRK